MFYLSPEGDRYYPGRAFSYGDYQYSAGAAKHDKFIELGFTAVTIQPRPDDRYFTVVGPDNTGAYTATPRDLDQLKLSLIMQQKQTARKMLAPSDWYIIRTAETGTLADQLWLDYRAAVRIQADARCAQIAAVTTVAELESLMKEPAEVPVDSDTAPEGYVMVDNPDPHLEPWPDPISEAEQVATGYDLDVDASGAY